MFIIPKATVYVVRKGDQGIVAWAVQRACNKLGIPTSEDAFFGSATEESVKRFQTLIGVEADGVVGPKTQQAFARLLCRGEENTRDLPGKILWSKILYESGGYLGAVNWSVAGGVDCGVTQRRVYEGDYDNDAVIKRAFDAAYQLRLSGERVEDLHAIYLARGVIRRQQTAWRCAVLAHNYPALADKISRVGFKGLSSYYTTPKDWVMVHRLKFPDGHEIKTPLEWGQRYALGNLDHDEPGQAVKLVSW
jgi:hypothetical protein